MGKLQWYANRLRAMNAQEVVWRLQQKRLERKERQRFGRTAVRVDAGIWNKEFESLQFHNEALGINLGNHDYTVDTHPKPLHGPDHDRWPDTFSHSLDYKQRDDLGDARTCWEKHRHFRYALLAKAFHATRNRDYAAKLEQEQEEWSRKNPFLHGIAWTSVMEVAIRSINWMLAITFCREGQVVERMRTGVINMTDYIVRHHSRFSSANNHLLVEAAAIGLAGYAFGHDGWKRLAVGILSEELPKQNYTDGVNRELSLHYQTFGMEAYCLMAHVMTHNGDSVPSQWIGMLEKQAEYVSHCVWHEQTVMEFGDDDEGKIVDLHGGVWQHPSYILQFCSLVTGRRFHSFDETAENIAWLYKKEEIEQMKSLPLYDNTKSRCFRTGGNTFMRDAADRILIGIDHAALGFGQIAAHGHADALSVQMMVDGKTVLADPGTYIYHCNLPMRNAFRRTVNHNTVCVLDKQGKPSDQSQMLGAFLWGKRAECSLEHWASDAETDVLTASHDGYRPVIHQRTVEFLGKDTTHPILRVKDCITDGNWVATWILGKDCRVARQEGQIEIGSGNNRIVMSINTETQCIRVEEADISEVYGIREKTRAIRIYGSQKAISVDFKIELYQQANDNGQKNIDHR